MEESKSFLKILSTITRYLLLSFIYLFVTVNKKFNNLSLLKFFLHADAVPQRCSPGGRCSADVLQMFGGVSIRMGDFNKVVEQICWICVPALLFSSEVASCVQSTFLRQHLWRTASEQRSFYIRFLVYSS